MTETYIPLVRIGDNYNIVMDAYPPYRENLVVHTRPLEQAMKLSNIGQRQIQVNFLPLTPDVSMSAGLSSEVDALAGLQAGTLENIAPFDKVVVEDDSNETIHWYFIYDREQLLSPEQTASYGSRSLRFAFGRTPYAVWTKRFVEEQAKYGISARLTEFKIFVNNVIPTLVTYFLFDAATNNSLRSFGVAVGFYNFVSILDLWSATVFNKENGEYISPEDWAISQDRRRAFYPATFVDEVVAPAALFQLANFVMPDMITTRENS